MKKTIFHLMLGVSLGLVILLFLFNHCSPGNKTTGLKGDYIKSHEKTSFDEVTARLNPGGNFYLYIGTEKIIKKVDQLATNLRQIIEANIAESSGDAQEGLKIFDFIYGMIKKSGLMEISGLGLSSVSINETINHSKIVTHHYKEKGKGLIWKLCESKPHPLSLLNMAPGNTVLAGYTDFNFSVLWEWTKSNIQAADIPKLKKGFFVIEPTLKREGIELGQLLNSISGMGYILSLDPQSKGSFPAGKTNISFPEPGIAFVLAVKDDYIFNLLASKLPKAQKSEAKDVKKIEIPIPLPSLPFSVSPVIAQTKGMLILASNKKLLEQMFEALEKENGLTTGDEFKKLSSNIPMNGNSFRFISSKLLQSLLDIQRQFIESDPTVDNEKNRDTIKRILNLFPKEMSAFGVLQHSPEGTVYSINHTMSLEGILLVPFTASVGVVAAIAIPNILTATLKGKQKATMGDMKSISMAIEMYITDFGNAPVAESIEELAKKIQPFYIRVLPLKDGWGNMFHYYHGTGAKNQEFAIGSGGKDGVFNGWEQTGSYRVSNTNDFDNDIIIANGEFTFSPKVK